MKYFWIVAVLLLLWIMHSCFNNVEEYTQSIGAFYDAPDELKRSLSGNYNTGSTIMDSSKKYKNTLHIDLVSGKITVNGDIDKIGYFEFYIIQTYSPYLLIAETKDKSHQMLLKVAQLADPAIMIFHKKKVDSQWKNIMGKRSAYSTRISDSNKGGITQLLVHTKNGTVHPPFIPIHGYKDLFTITEKWIFTPPTFMYKNSSITFKNLSNLNEILKTYNIRYKLKIKDFSTGKLINTRNNIIHIPSIQQGHLPNLMNLGNLEMDASVNNIDKNFIAGVEISIHSKSDKIISLEYDISMYEAIPLNKLFDGMIANNTLLKKSLIGGICKNTSAIIKLPSGINEGQEWCDESADNCKHCNGSFVTST